jgi:SulP family sulfate permease
MPALGWLPAYRRTDLGADVSAGLLLAVLLIPQSMAFALLAGLPASSGLYAATVPAIVYAFFGSSRHVNVGPAAIISLLTFSGVAALADPGTSEYIGLALLLMLLVGVIQLGLGLIRAGFIARFFSQAVLSGFTSAAAIVIALTQIENLLGLEVEGGAPITTLLAVGREIQNIHWTTAAVGLGSLTLLIAYRVFVPRLPARLILSAARFPAPLILVIGGTLLVWGLGLDAAGVHVVGDIPRGLPEPSLPELDRGAILDLAPAAVAITFIGYVQSISVARTIAVREKDAVDANQELHALGLANIAGAFFSGFPVTGSFARTAVNYQAGSRTQVSGLTAAGLILLTLLVLTPLFYYLPNAVLAATIIVAVSGLVNVREARHYFDVRRLDGLTVAATFVVTLAIGVAWGVIAGLAFSLVVFIWRSTDPHAVEAGYDELEDHVRAIGDEADVITFPNTLILQISAPLYFANIEELARRIELAAAEREDLEWVVLDFTGVVDVDAVAVDLLEDLLRSYRAAGVTVLFAGVRGHVLDVFVRAGWRERHSRALYHPTVRMALESLGLLDRYTGGGRVGLFGALPQEEIMPGGEAERPPVRERRPRDR